MNHDPGSPPRAALKDYLAALHISSLSAGAAAAEDEDNQNRERSYSSERGKTPSFILIDDNMKATPSFLLASTTPPKPQGRRRPLNRSTSLPSKVSGQPRRKSSSLSSSSRIKNDYLEFVAAGKKKTTITDTSQPTSLVRRLLHTSRKEEQSPKQQDHQNKVLDDYHDDDEEDDRDSKLWCRWDNFTSSHLPSNVDKQNSKNDTSPENPRRKSHDQGVSLPTRTILEEDY